MISNRKQSKNTALRGMGFMHVEEARAGTDNLKDAAKVLKYAGDKELSARDTRQVTERTFGEFAERFAIPRNSAGTRRSLVSWRAPIERSRRRKEAEKGALEPQGGIELPH